MVFLNVVEMIGNIWATYLEFLDFSKCVGSNMVISMRIKIVISCVCIVASFRSTNLILVNCKVVIKEDDGGKLLGRLRISRREAN